MKPEALDLASFYSPANLPMTAAGRDKSLLPIVARRSKEALNGGRAGTRVALQTETEDGSSAK